MLLVGAPSLERAPRFQQCSIGNVLQPGFPGHQSLLVCFFYLLSFFVRIARSLVAISDGPIFTRWRQLDRFPGSKPYLHWRAFLELPRGAFHVGCAHPLRFLPRKKILILPTYQTKTITPTTESGQTRIGDVGGEAKPSVTLID